MQSRTTNIFEKLVPSLINVVIVLILSAPFYIFWGFGLKWKLAAITIFFIYSLVFALFNSNRCLGMVVMRTDWLKGFSFVQKILYVFLYTLSFSTIFFWLAFPFDILLINLLFIQLPMVLTKGTTMHGYLSGNNKTVRYYSQIKAELDNRT